MSLRIDGKEVGVETQYERTKETANLRRGNLLDQEIATDD